MSKIYIDSRTILNTIDRKSVVRPKIDIHTVIWINDATTLVPTKQFVKDWNGGKCIQDAIKSCITINSEVCSRGVF
jgi:hypothetical protein